MWVGFVSCMCWDLTLVVVGVGWFAGVGMLCGCYDFGVGGVFS